MDNNETVARELRDNSDAAVEASGGYQSKEISPSVKRMLDAQKQKNSDAARKTWPQIKLKVRDGNGLEALVDLEMIRSEAVEAMGIHQEEMRLGLSRCDDTCYSFCKWQTRMAEPQRTRNRNIVCCLMSYPGLATCWTRRIFLAEHNQVYVQFYGFKWMIGLN